LKQGRNDEAQKGTNKGREFEVALYDHVAKLSRELETKPNSWRTRLVLLAANKKGD